ncbi:hypothetical protein ACFFX0_10865 [Citricoccus parietis]|uniref:Uncharacterized protein n=1 Tax=Citricoccus parietis TaxID=592307 RepID=A0ABV5FYD4_9MICC
MDGGPGANFRLTRGYAELAPNRVRTGLIQFREFQFRGSRWTHRLRRSSPLRRTRRRSPSRSPPR